MVLGRMDAGTHRRAIHERTGEPRARAVAQPADMTDELIERGIDESQELKFGDGTEALCGESHRHPRDQGLGKRRVHHALLAETLEEPFRRAEDTAVLRHVLAEHDHARVVRHGAGERHRNRPDQGDFAHRESLASFLRCHSRLAGSVSNRWSNMDWGCGGGIARYSATAASTFPLHWTTSRSSSSLDHQPRSPRYVRRRAMGSVFHAALTSSWGR